MLRIQIIIIMSLITNIIDIISKYFRPDHSYSIILIQVLFTYIVYTFTRATFHGLNRYKSYRKITLIESLTSSQASSSQESSSNQLNFKQSSKGKRLTALKDQIGKDVSLADHETQKRKQAVPEVHLTHKEALKIEKQLKHQLGKEKNNRIGTMVNHPKFLSAMKGFGNQITDFSFGRKYVVAASYDQTIKVFEMSQFFLNHQDPKSYFIKLQDMHATAVCLSKKFDTVHLVANQQLFQLDFNLKAEDKRYFNLIAKTRDCSKSEINNIHVDESEKCLITTSSDTFIKVWGMKGELLREVNTSYGQHYSSQLSGNFLTISSWSQDTSIFEIKYNKDGSFRNVEKVLLLRGERGSLIDTSIDECCKRAAVVDKNSVKFYKIDVDVKNKEEPKLIAHLKFAQVNAATMFDMIYLVGAGVDLQVYDVNMMKILNISNAANGAQIKRLRLHKLHSSIQNKTYLVCFVWGQDQDRINIFDFSEYYHD